ncbi:MAG: alcohol dehydrogenase catalytic domain-containing protein [Halieaceae bacterium]|jgi:2-desacetyl-2-hydroxyethyl bacteriochlorophyllide A dehydrogenase|nr:alcohol dehydrogenase catalytic domain-containing protein [Halieaceae bacterium]
MATMPLARVHKPNDIRLDHVESPKAGPNDVIVQVQRCGICGSDLSYAKIGGIPGAASPFAIGHEFAGIVTESGKNVSHVAVGDRVVVNPEGAWNGIGSAGVKGAFAPYIQFEDASQDPGAVIKLPDTIDFDLGALVEPLSVAMHGVDRGQVGYGDKVAVFGAGPVGLGTALVARYYGAQNVVITDLSEKRLAIARELGLTTFKADEGDISDFLKQQHGSVMLGPLLGEQPATDVLFEATGAGPVFHQILNLARKQARVVVIGVHFVPIELDMINFLVREVSIIASQAYDNDVFLRVIAMLESGEVNVKPMITHQFPLSEFGEAFAQASRQNEAIKVIVNCQD